MLGSARSLSARLGSYLLRPAFATLATALAAAVALAIGAYAVVEHDRETDLNNAERELQNMSVVLAEQARQAVTAANLIVDAVADDAQAAAAQTPEEFRERMSTRAVYERLLNRIQGIPQLDVTTVVDVDGNVINFSRSYPPAQINLADRDYFIAHSTGAPNRLFISAPVKNRGNGEWTFYLSRAIRNRDGRFIGLVLTGIKPAFFEDFFKRVSIGSEAALSLLRDDGVLLAGYPHIDDAIGRSFRDAPAFRVLRERPEGGVARATGPRTADQQDTDLRIVAPRPVPGLPLVVNITNTQDTILETWRWRMSQLVAGTLAAIALVLILGAFAFRLLQGREKVLSDLVRSKAEVEEAALVKSRFLGAMSHEIRTPMNAVLGMAGVLLDSPLDPDQRNKVRLIRDSGDLLLKVINDILDLTKLDAGKVDLEQIPFDPRAMTADTISLMGSRATAKGIKIEVKSDGGVPACVLGDPSRVRQILFNLVGNAVKFTDHGRITVTMASRVRGDGRPSVEWTITDTGVGIPPDRIRALFAEFVQADNSIARRFGGTGLGLVISKRLVDLMGGTITVDSELGKGTTVRFALPLAEAAGEPTLSEPDTTVGQELDRALALRARPLRILIAEDNATNQFVAQAILRRPRINVDVVGNGLEAVEAISRHDYDLVLMDVQMPEMDGLTATRMIRQRGGRYARLPIVAFSANAFAEDIEACRIAGMSDNVIKPVRKDALLAAVLRSLATATSDSTAEALRLPVVDADALDGLVEDIGRDGGRSTITVFVDNTQRRLQNLPARIAEREHVLVEVHAIKGSARLVGATRLAALAETLERRLTTGMAVAVEDLAPLGQAFDAYRTAPAVRALLADPARSAAE